MKPTSPSAQTGVFAVSPAQAGKRLDVFLTDLMADFSRSQVRSLIDAGRVEACFPVKEIKASLLVSEGQSFRVTIPPMEKTDIPAQALDLSIVFEDEDLLVLDKPVGLVVHPGAGNPDHTLINALVAHCPDIAGVGGVGRPGLVHRLDKDTSGLMVAAKSDLAYKSLVRQLRGRKLSREYLALVEGVLAGGGTVDAAIGRHSMARNKMAVRPDTGKPAVTHFAPLESNETASLLHLKLETGRTHQIRAHMAFIKHPVLGDSVYGGDSKIAGRQMLHAFRLSIRHPKTGNEMAFFAGPPKDFTECLSLVGLKTLDWKEITWKKS
jgi:23S rRNA pseudouridine1911/1915/1917 synthase